MNSEQSSNLLNKKNIRLYYGSPEIVYKPCYLVGEKTNDYGQGFYCVTTGNKELAKEWACSECNKSGIGYVNSYKFRTENMKILDLTSMDILFWITLTATYRNMSAYPKQLNDLQKKYLIDLSEYDCVYGWRCDDMFAAIVSEFLYDWASAESVQDFVDTVIVQKEFVLISEKAFNNIEFIDAEQIDNFSKYRKRYNKRLGLIPKGSSKSRRIHRSGHYLYEIIGRKRYE